MAIAAWAIVLLGHWTWLIVVRRLGRDGSSFVGSRRDAEPSS
jgi:hypothetical protein